MNAQEKNIRCIRYCLIGLLVVLCIYADDNQHANDNQKNAPSMDELWKNLDDQMRINLTIQPEPRTRPEYFYDKYEEVDTDESNFDIATPTLPEWLCRASVGNAPELLHGMFAYLSTHHASQVIPTCHRFILVGKPGTGKTTLAQAFAQSLGYEVTFISAASLLGKHRNHTALNIRSLFDRLRSGESKKALIIDELHKLFEHYESEHTDTYDNAMAFWTELDQLEHHNNNIIVIGTANRVDILPPEIKSRFYGKIIEMPLPNKQQKLKALRDLIQHDASIQVNISDSFLQQVSSQIKNYSLRDVQTLLDTAKMFFYAETTKGSRTFQIDPLGHHDIRQVVLKEHHFKRALKYLKNDPAAKTWYTQMRPKIKEWGEVIGVAAQTVFMSSACVALVQQGYMKLPSLLNI